MERTVALKKLEKLLGKKMAWRINPRAPTPEEREAAKLALPAARAKREAAEAEKNARYRAILDGDAEYQRLVIAHRESRKESEAIAGAISYRKITVGRTEGMFFMVRAEGDSWEEVIAKLTPEKVAM